MEKLNRAIKFAVDRHCDQLRKVVRLPYILHPMEAVVVASTLTDDEDVLSAVVLHDVVEDTPTTIDEVRELFGDRVAELVMGDSENKYRDLPPDATWERRKTESLEQLKKNTDRGVRIMWLSDKLSNIRSLWSAAKRNGDAVWQHFHQKDPRKVAWYYRSIVDILRDDFSEYDVFLELEWMVNDLFKGVEK